MPLYRVDLRHVKCTFRKLRLPLASTVAWARAIEWPISPLEPSPPNSLHWLTVVVLQTAWVLQLPRRVHVTNLTTPLPVALPVHGEEAVPSALHQSFKSALNSALQDYLGELINGHLKSVRWSSTGVEPRLPDFASACTGVKLSIYVAFMTSCICAAWAKCVLLTGWLLSGYAGAILIVRKSVLTDMVTLFIEYDDTYVNFLLSRAF